MDFLSALVVWSVIVVLGAFALLHEIRVTRRGRIEKQRRKAVAKQAAYWSAHPEEHAAYLQDAITDWEQYLAPAEIAVDDMLTEWRSDLAAVQARLAPQASARS